MGRGLARRKSFLLGLLCREGLVNVMMDVVRGIQDVIQDTDYSLITYFHGDNIEDEAKHVQFGLERQVDGLIIMPVLEPSGRANTDLFLDVEEAGVPAVQIFTSILRNVPSIMADDRLSGYMACRHLIELGHRRIVHLTHESYDDERIPGSFKDATERWRGYEDAMSEAGLEAEVVTFPLLGSGVKMFESAYAIGDRIIEHPMKPTAVVAYNDHSALGLIKILYEAGTHVPRAMSIVGFDDRDASAVGVVALTTLNVPGRRIGQGAARMVLELTGDEPSENLVIAPELIVRSSTCPPCS